MSVTTDHEPTSFRKKLALRGIDGVTLLVLPSVIFVLAIFIYPFIYGLMLSFTPIREGGMFANYIAFFSDPYLYNTIGATLKLAIPVTLLCVAFAVPVAMRVRLLKHQRLLTTILVLPITLGTVLVAQGMLNYLGPQGWFSRTLMLLHIVDSPVKLTNNYWGVFLSLVVTVFPFTFLLTLSYVTGIDPGLEKAAATHGASSWPDLRPGLRSLPVSGASRRSIRADARHLDCRGSGRVRAIRFHHGLGDRHDHGRRAALHRADCTRHPQSLLPWRHQWRERLSHDPRYFHRS
jgi:putative spermidine/putrescine transport system permease protein